MNSQRWARIRDIFSEALEMTADQRSTFIDQACTDDATLRAEVLDLLSAADKELESPVSSLMESQLEGSCVDRYRIECRIGRGGMGEVYRAFDPELDRTVALKILPVSAEPEWRARFMREARAASAIAHPNVVRIYDVGEAGGLTFIAMEFVEGRSLDHVIPSGGIGMQRALEYAEAIASGLVDAHARGIAHRDLKPSNIMITPQDEVKLLDFGLAKQVELNRGSDPTLTMRGEILGTPAYMSPEQAEGKDVDTRTDIFSFGSVLYQMLSGNRAFEGDSAVAIMGAILREEPKPLPWLPGELRTLLRRCLQKDPSRRAQHIADVRLVIAEIRETLPGRRVARRWWLSAAMTAILFSATAAITFYVPSKEEREGTRPQFIPFATEAPRASSPAWSPDGKTIAYRADVEGVAQVFVRNIGSSTAAVITQSPRDCGRPFWSTDGRRVFYNVADELWSSGLAGGEPRLELRDAREAARSPDGTTLTFLRGKMGEESLWIQSEDRKEPWRFEREPFPSSFVKGYQPTFFPDGSRIGIVIDRSTGGGTGEFWILPFGWGRPHRVPVELDASAWLHFSWWKKPDAVLMARSNPGRSHLEWMDLKSGAIRSITNGVGHESEPALSPDGRTIAFTEGREDLDLIDAPLDGSPIRSLLTTSLDEQSGSWLPSGSEYAYITNRSGSPEVWLRHTSEIWAKPILGHNADGVPPWYLLYCLRASPDGQHVSYDVLARNHRIWISSIAGGRPAALEEESTDQHAASWSPDGKQIAYRRLHEGKFELAAVAVGGGTPQRLGESGPGGHMRGGVTDWSPTGEWICHNSPSGLEVVSPDSKRRRLLSSKAHRLFVFSRDGKTVVVVRRSERRQWVLAWLSVADGAQRKLLELPLATDLSIFDMTRHPDGKRLLLTISTSRQGIWLMRGF